MRRILHRLRQGSIALIIAFVVIAAGVLLYGRSQGYTVLSVQTGSMRPSIHPGDAVMVRHSQQQYRVGQIVSYHSLDNPKLIITHRIVAVDPTRGQLTTKGDALDEPDPVIATSRVIGTVEHTIPLMGYGFDILRRPIGLVAAVYIPAVSIIAAEIRRLQRYYDRRQYRLLAYPW